MASGRKKQCLKIVVLGDSGVGKTTLLQQYVTSKDPSKAKDIGKSKPTIGADFQKKEIMVDNQQVTLQLWDTAGQEKFQSLGYAFYRGSDSCALVFDLTSQKSFDALSRWKEGFLTNAAPNEPGTFPFVLVGNKVDRTEQRVISPEAIQTWCRQNGDMPYYEASAIQNISVDDAFIEMVKLAMKRESSN